MGQQVLVRCKQALVNYYKESNVNKNFTLFTDIKQVCLDNPIIK